MSLGVDFATQDLACTLHSQFTHLTAQRFAGLVQLSLDIILC